MDESGVSAFVNECCTQGPEERCGSRWLYTAWQKWCEENGAQDHGHATFGKNLKAAFPEIEKKDTGRIDGERYRYSGISLRRKDFVDIAGGDGEDVIPIPFVDADLPGVAKGL